MFALFIVAICACACGRPLWRWCHGTNESPSSVEGAEVVGAEVEVEAETVAVARARLTQTTLQAASSAPHMIAVIATNVPSAQATLISPEEAVMYETAAAEVTSNAVWLIAHETVKHTVDYFNRENRQLHGIIEQNRIIFTCKNRYEGTHSRHSAIVSMSFCDNVHIGYYT